MKKNIVGSLGLFCAVGILMPSGLLRADLLHQEEVVESKTEPTSKNGVKNTSVIRKTNRLTGEEDYEKRTVQVHDEMGGRVKETEKEKLSAREADKEAKALRD